MRRAEQLQAWDRLQRAEGVLSTFSFEGVPSLGSGLLEAAPLTFLTGLNGAGKTQVLWCLQFALAPSNTEFHDHVSRTLSEGYLSATLCWRQQALDVSLSLGEEGRDARVVSDNSRQFLEAFQVEYINTGRDVPRLQSEFRSDPNFDDLLEGVDSLSLKRSDVRTLSSLAGRRYDSVELYEIEVGGTTAPYFHVSVGGLSYGAESMGLGEYAAFFLFWKLTSRSWSSCLILLDEPEAFLSPRSQPLLASLLAKVCVATKSSFIVTTHSPALVAKVPRQYVRCIVRRLEGNRILGADGPIMRHIGLETSLAAIILVEDRAARDWVRWIVRSFAPDYVEAIDVLQLGSHSDVVALLRLIPQKFTRLGVLAVLDGDMRHEYAELASDEHFGSRVQFLPGDAPPDDILMMLAQQEHMQLAPRLGVSAERLGMALDEVDGVNYHDWALELGRSLGLSSSSQLLDAVFQLIEERPGLWSQTKALGASLLTFLDR